jgi:hypothetical protein
LIFIWLSIHANDLTLCSVESILASKAEQEILDRYGVMAARLQAVFATYAAAQAEPWKESFLRGSELIKTLQVYRTKKLTKS